VVDGVFGKPLRGFEIAMLQGTLRAIHGGDGHQFLIWRGCRL
jgi:hypothetical protein